MLIENLHKVPSEAEDLLSDSVSSSPIKREIAQAKLRKLDEATTEEAPTEEEPKGE